MTLITLTVLHSVRSLGKKNAPNILASFWRSVALNFNVYVCASQCLWLLLCLLTNVFFWIYTKITNNWSLRIINHKSFYGCIFAIILRNIYQFDRFAQLSSKWSLLFFGSFFMNKYSITNFAEIKNDISSNKVWICNLSKEFAQYAEWNIFFPARKNIC